MKVLLADDHLLTLEGIRSVLAQVDDIEIVGEARSGPDVLAIVKQTEPDMVVMDVRMPGLDGLQALDILRRHHPRIKVVLLSAYAEADKVQEGLRRGAAAYIVKSVNPLDLPSGLRQAFEGTFFSAPGADRSTSAEAGPDTATVLTERELSILRAVAGGLSNKAISKEMWVTEQTVKFHLTNIYRKLGVANRTAAARYAHSHGLLDDSPVAASVS